MEKKELSFVEIRAIAFRTTAHSHNSEWKAHSYGKLTSSKFGRVISVIKNPDSTNIQRLRDDIYAQKNPDHVPAIKWGMDHQSGAIDANLYMSNNVVKPTGIWKFRKQHYGRFARWTRVHWPTHHIRCRHHRSEMPHIRFVT